MSNWMAWLHFYLELAMGGRPVILHFDFFTSEVDSTDSLAAPVFAGDKSTITSDNRRHKL
jgi:hypothetical protein